MKHLFLVRFLAVILVISTLLYFGLEYLDKSLTERSVEKLDCFRMNGKKSKGFLVNKWAESRRYKLHKYTDQYIEVSYVVDSKAYSSKILMNEGFERVYPEKGDSIIVFYDPLNPEEFMPYWSFE